MAKLLLLRHFKSQWNEENRFTGWVDVPLVKNSFKIPAIDFDLVYTSPLIRNLATVLRVLENKGRYPIFRHFQGKMKKWSHFKELNKNYIPVFVSEALNERYYGKLQGLNKEETIKKFGKTQVHQWRRGFDIKPPGGESLKDVIKRTTPFYQKYIEKDLKAGKNVLVVASHNSLRAVIKHIEKIADKNISQVEMAYGELRVYQFNNKRYTNII